jgi:hypothetical protein
VKLRLLGKEVILIVCFIFFFSALAFAQGKDIQTKGKDIQTKGKVMQLDFAKKTVFVNEKAFVWDANSVFYDEKGSPVYITEDRLKQGTLVSIEFTWIKNKPLVIKKLSLLPK